jgi:peroxiredoxin
MGSGGRWLRCAAMDSEGKPAPTFTLASDTGEQVSLESFRGRPVVLSFYPKDDCRAEIEVSH